MTDTTQVKAIPRISAAGMGRDELLEFFKDPTTPLIITDSTNVFNVNGLDKVSSASALIAWGSDDVVGFVPTDPTLPAKEVPFTGAMNSLVEFGGHINGWEYLSGDSGEVLRVIAEEIDDAIRPHSVVPGLDDVHGERLDSVMKWIFISSGESTGSDWHVDPIGSNAWMLLVSGSKRWFMKGDGGTVEYIDTLSVGELLIVPGGVEHKVENTGAALNVAVSHNWVGADSNSERLMWKELVRGLRLVETTLLENPGSPRSTEELLELVQNDPACDHLLFGLVMIAIHSEEFPTRVSDGKRRGVIEDSDELDLMRIIHSVRERMS